MMHIDYLSPMYLSVDLLLVFGVVVINATANYKFYI